MNIGINQTITVDSIMTTDVIALSSDARMTEASTIFENRLIHHIPIIDSEEIVIGIISRSDYLQMQNTFTAFNSAAAQTFNKQFFESMLVNEVMTKPVVMLRPNDSLYVAMDFFRENRFHAMPVVGEYGKLIGIISTYDLLNYAFSDLVLPEESLEPEPN